MKRKGLEDVQEEEVEDYEKVQEEVEEEMMKRQGEQKKRKPKRRWSCGVINNASHLSPTLTFLFTASFSLLFSRSLRVVRPVFGSQIPAEAGWIQQES